MEIMKIGVKTWQIAIIRQICQSFFTANVFYCTVPLVSKVNILPRYGV